MSPEPLLNLYATRDAFGRICLSACVFVLHLTFESLDQTTEVHFQNLQVFELRIARSSGQG